MQEARWRKVRLVEDKEQSWVWHAQRVGSVVLQSKPRASGDHDRCDRPDPWEMSTGNSAKSAFRAENEAEDEDELPGERVEVPESLDGPGRQVDVEGECDAVQREG